MKQPFFIPILILAFSFTVFAQTSENLCPKIKIKSPETVKPDEPFKVSASFENESQPSKSKFDWTIIIGDEVSKTKESGIIEINPKSLEEDGGLIILLAESLDEKCTETALNKVYVIPHFGHPYELDQYSKLDWNDERMHLNFIADTFKKFGDSELFITFNFTKETSKSRKRERLLKVFKYLTETGGLEKNRIMLFISETDPESVSFLPMLKGSSTDCYYDNCFVIRGEDLEKIVNMF